MATFVPIGVDAVFIGTGDTVIGQPPAGKSWAVARVPFCNSDTSDHTVTIGVITAGSLDDQHTEWKELTVQAKSTFEYGPAYLTDAQKLVAKADTASKISARLHGIEKTP